jgi:hypothetical protein
MRLIMMMSVSCLIAAAAAATTTGFDESVRRAVGFQVFQYDPKLKQLFGGRGADSACWPSALAHRMIYFQRYRSPALPKLHLNNEPLSNVEIFARACHTNLNGGGTAQKYKVPCIQEFLRKSGYEGGVYEIGVSSAESEFRRPVRVSDLLEAIRKDAGVILHVGWLRFDSKRHAWVEKGSHSLNAYGFDYNRSWNEDRVRLQVSNPSVDYSSRPADQMYDLVELSKLVHQGGVGYPSDLNLAVTGRGFDRDGRLAVLDDIFVFEPKAEIK